MVVNGMLILAIWFLLWGLAQLVPHGAPGVGYVLGVLAVIVGILLLLGR